MAKKSNTDTTITESKSLLTDFDIYLFKSGKHYKLYEKLGARIVKFGAGARRLLCRVGSECKSGFGYR
jgi:hypothetical protein